jgi:hypothetical protein
MGALFDLRARIDKAIEERRMDGAAMKGKIGLQTGFLLSLISPSSPDDPAKIEKLRKAAADVLQLRL